MDRIEQLKNLLIVNSQGTNKHVFVEKREDGKWNVFQLGKFSNGAQLWALTVWTDADIAEYVSKYVEAVVG